MLALFWLFLLLLLPGYFVVRIDDRLTEHRWLTFVLSFAVSNALLLALGLLLNTVLPLFGITDPLHPRYVRLASTVLFTSLFIGSWLVKPPRLPHETFFHLDPSRIARWLLLILVPLPSLITIFGTLALNNGEMNTISLVGLAAVAIQMIVSLPLATLFPKRAFFYGWTLLSIAVAVIFMTSLRGTHVTGSDIMLEYRMAAITQAQQRWIPGVPNHAYNACLSIALLPVVISNLGGVSLVLVYKIFLQFSSILSVILVFHVARKYVGDHLAYASSIAFLSFPAFFNIMPMHLRQSLALFFFFTIVYFVVESGRSRVRQFLAYLFAIGMVLSHYSTSYIAMGVFFAYYITAGVLVIVTRYINLPFISRAEIKVTPFFRYINPIFLLFLLGVMYLWYFQVSSVGRGFTNFVSKVEQNLTSESAIASKEESTLLNQFNVFLKPSEEKNVREEYQKKLFEEYQQDAAVEKRFYAAPVSEFTDIELTSVPEQLIPLQLEPKLADATLLFAETVKKMYKVFTILGVVVIFYAVVFRKDKTYDYQFLLLTFLFFGVIVLFTVMPFFNVDYDVFRTYYQLLIVLALPSALGVMCIGLGLSTRWKTLLAVCFFTLYFVVNSRLFYEKIGDYPPSLVLANDGDGYDMYYIQPSEILSTKWLETYGSEYLPVHTDTYTKIKMRSISTSELLISDELTPYSIDHDNYVLFSQSNIVGGVAYKNFLNHLIRYEAPVEFVSERKNKIYANQGSEIYR